MGEGLEVHMKALDLTDVNSKQEFEAYKYLSRGLREISAGLAVISQEMAGIAISRWAGTTKRRWLVQGR